MVFSAKFNSALVRAIRASISRLQASSLMKNYLSSFKVLLIKSEKKYIASLNLEKQILVSSSLCKLLKYYDIEFKSLMVVLLIKEFSFIISQRSLKFQPLCYIIKSKVFFESTKCLTCFKSTLIASISKTNYFTLLTFSLISPSYV